MDWKGYAACCLALVLCACQGGQSNQSPALTAQPPEGNTSNGTNVNLAFALTSKAMDDEVQSAAKNQLIGANSRTRQFAAKSTLDWPDYIPPKITSTVEGPWNFSGNTTLWFNLTYSDHEGSMTHTIKLDNTISDTPEETTSEKIFFRIAQTVGNDLILGHSPLSITGPSSYQGKLELTAIIESGMTLTQLGFYPENRMSQGGLEIPGKIYSGHLISKNKTTSEQFFQPWSIFVKDGSFDVISNSTLVLTPGEYHVELLLSHYDQQLGGEADIDVAEESTVDLTIPLAPVVGNANLSVNTLSQFSVVNVKFTLEELASFSTPRLGIVTNSQDESLFDINTAHPLNEFYINTLDNIDALYLKFYDGTSLLGKSATLTANQLTDESTAIYIDILPLYAHINMDYNQESGNSVSLKLNIPNDIINLLGDLNQIQTKLTVQGAATPSQEKLIESYDTEDNGASLSTEFTILAAELLSLNIQFINKINNSVVGGCQSQWTVSINSPALLCQANVISNEVINASLKSAVAIHATSVSGSPISGLIIKDQFNQVWGTTNNNETLMHNVLPGEYLITGTLDNEIVITQSIIVLPLQTKNIVLVINDAEIYPPLSCRDLIMQFPESESGFYVIDPDGPSLPDDNSNMNPFTVYCEMEIQNGGWTLIGFHQDNTHWKQVATVSPYSTQSLGAGLLGSLFWQAIVPTISTGLLFRDEHSNISYLPISELDSATCVKPLSDVESLTAENSALSILYLSNDASCDLSDEDYSAVLLRDNSENGVQLVNGISQPFSLWPYQTSQSGGEHNQLWLYVK